MKTKSVRENKINIITLGCSKNTYDSEILARQLEANKFDVIHEADGKPNQIVIINTCGFIEKSKVQSIETILTFSELKKEKKIEKLYVTGCLSERYKDDLLKEIKNVDGYFGTKELIPLLKILKADYKKELIGEQSLINNNHYAYLKISEGCDRTCSFCAIPLMRGKHISFPEEQIINSAKSLASKGVKELILIAQDLNYYGIDINKTRTLDKLLEKLSLIDGIKWIRLHYAYPTGFNDELINIIANNPKICKYIDIPIQHVSDRILKSMRRGYSKNTLEKLLEKFRNKIPNLTIRTTLISGYPDETEYEFIELCDFIKKYEIDRLGVFTYSHEKDTHAYKLKDNISIKIKEKRASEIMKIQSKISYNKNFKKVGKNFIIIVDDLIEGGLIGRSEADSPEIDNNVIILDNVIVPKGTFLNVEIVEAMEYDLIAKIKN